MFNLPELLTVLIGSLLALVFIDGIRRALRIKRSALKVDLVETSESVNKDFEEEWMQGFKDETVEQEVAGNKEDSLEEGVLTPSISVSPSNSLFIIHLHSKVEGIFSKKTISTSLDQFNFVIEEKGFFTILDSKGNIAFTVINGKKPGLFDEDIVSDDLAMVLDPNNLSNPVESFDLLLQVSKALEEKFNCDLLDEDRNLLTKQMIEHMRQKVHDHRRQFLASTG